VGGGSKDELHWLKIEEGMSSGRSDADLETVVREEMVGEGRGRRRKRFRNL